MFPLIETIRIENGILQNLTYHQARLDRSRFELLGLKGSIDLESIISIPDCTGQGVYKCRVLYSRSIGKIEFIPYQPKPIKTLKLVFDDDINYPYKFSDRTKLEELLLRKGNCDEILIVKNGMITDTSYSNIVFYDGKNWLTPEQPLLEGTKRASLLACGKIKTAKIRIDNLPKFSKFILINAMLEFDEKSGLPIENILAT